MQKADIDAFHAKRETLDPEKYLVLTYYLESLVEPREGSRICARRCPPPNGAGWTWMKIFGRNLARRWLILNDQ